MDRTLDELGQRLRPSNLIDSVVAYFAGDRTPSAPTTGTGPRDETVKRAARNAGTATWQKLRDNPLAATGIAASIAWMFLKDHGPSYSTGHASRERILRNSREPRMYGGSYVDARTGEPYDIEHYGDAAREGEGKGWAGRMAEYAGEKAHDVADAAKGAASSAASATGEAISHAGHSAAESTRHGTSAAWKSARSATGSAYGSSRHAAAHGYTYSRDRFEDSIHEHPLAVGVAALAAGVLAGLVVPRTRTEDRYIGGYSRQMKDDASDLAHEAYDRGRHVAETGYETARTEAERRGLHPSDLKGEASTLVEHAKEAAGRVADAAVAGAKSAAHEAKSAVGEATDQAKREADRLQSEVAERGDRPQDLKETVAAVAESTKEAVAEDARHQKDEMRHENSQA